MTFRPLVNITMLGVQLLIATLVTVLNSLSNMHKPDKYKISYFDAKVIQMYTLKHISKLANRYNRRPIPVAYSVRGADYKSSSVPDTYYMCLTNEILDTDDYKECDGNQVDLDPVAFTSYSAEHAVYKGYLRLKEDEKKGTICGSYERRNSFITKHLLLILSNVFAVVNIRHTSHALPAGWGVVYQNLSTIIIFVTLIMTSTLLWQMVCLVTCVTTQMLIEYMSKLGVKLACVVGENGISEGDVKCWYATSVRVADITVKFDNSNPVYMRKNEKMAERKKHCEFLRKDMESLMSWMSENARKLVGCNLTGVLVYYMAMNIPTDISTGAKDSISLACFALFIGSAWHTLAAANGLVAYGYCLNKLKLLTIDVNLIGMPENTLETTEFGRESVTLHPGRQKRVSDPASKSSLVMRPSCSATSIADDTMPAEEPKTKTTGDVPAEEPKAKTSDVTMSSESVDREKVATRHKLNKFFVSPESSKCLLKRLDNTATDRYNKILNVSTKYISTKRLMHKVDGDLLCVVCKTIACFEEYEGTVSNDIIECVTKEIIANADDIYIGGSTQQIVRTVKNIC